MQLISYRKEHLRYLIRPGVYVLLYRAPTRLTSTITHIVLPTALCCGELWLAMLATLHAENTPSFSSFLARGKARTWAFFWLARCCWLRPGLAGSLFPEPEPVAAVLDPADPADWAWTSRVCKACAAGSDISTLLQSSSAPV